MKIRDLKITSKMADKHKKTMIALSIITYILLFPFVILDYYAIKCHGLELILYIQHLKLYTRKKL